MAKVSTREPVLLQDARGGFEGGADDLWDTGGVDCDAGALLHDARVDPGLADLGVCQVAVDDGDARDCCEDLWRDLCNGWGCGDIACAKC